MGWCQPEAEISVFCFIVCGLRQLHSPFQEAWIPHLSAWVLLSTHRVVEIIMEEEFGMGVEL